MKCPIIVFALTALFSLHNSCFGEIDPQAIAAKKSSASALAEAIAAESTKNVNFKTADEKSTAIQEKAMSALSLAMEAKKEAHAILTVAPAEEGAKSTTPHATPESKSLAEKAIKEADEAIKKAGSVLASS